MAAQQPGRRGSTFENVTSLAEANVLFLHHKDNGQLTLAQRKLMSQINNVSQKQVCFVKVCESRDFVSADNVTIQQTIAEKLGFADDKFPKQDNILWLCIENNLGRSGEKQSLSVAVVKWLNQQFPNAKIFFYTQGTGFEVPDDIKKFEFFSTKVLWGKTPQDIVNACLLSVSPAPAVDALPIVEAKVAVTTVNTITGSSAEVGASKTAEPVLSATSGNSAGDSGVVKVGPAATEPTCSQKMSALLFAVTCGCAGTPLNKVAPAGAATSTLGASGLGSPH